MLRPTPISTHKCKHSTHTHTPTQRLPFSHSLGIGGGKPYQVIGGKIDDDSITVQILSHAALGWTIPTKSGPRGSSGRALVSLLVSARGRQRLHKQFSYFCQPPLTRQRDRNPRRDWNGPKKDRADRLRSAGSDKSSKPVADVWVPGHQNMEASPSAAYRLEIWGCTRLL